MFRQRLDSPPVRRRRLERRFLLGQRRRVHGVEDSSLTVSVAGPNFATTRPAASLARRAASAGVAANRERQGNRRDSRCRRHR
jgi:hypothetical protein